MKRPFSAMEVKMTYFGELTDIVTAVNVVMCGALECGALECGALEWLKVSA